MYAEVPWGRLWHGTMRIPELSNTVESQCSARMAYKTIKRREISHRADGRTQRHGTMGRETLARAHMYCRMRVAPSAGKRIHSGWHPSCSHSGGFCGGKTITSPSAGRPATRPALGFTSTSSPRMLLSRQDEVLQVEGRHAVGQPRVGYGRRVLRPGLVADRAGSTLSFFETSQTSRPATAPRDIGVVKDVAAQWAEVLRRAERFLHGRLRLLPLHRCGGRHAAPDVGAVHLDDCGLPAVLQWRPPHGHTHVLREHRAIPRVHLVGSLIDQDQVKLG
mmetsp:Transcript_110679/g.344900  ORF Transcript_110679/g.344900 Transcript_110679/m.344900 type:complete len:277 (+) Transcript_110679:289-1119(+)